VVDSVYTGRRAAFPGAYAENQSVHFGCHSSEVLFDVSVSSLGLISVVYELKLPHYSTAHTLSTMHDYKQWRS
jgi:hypothetical protein